MPHGPLPIALLLCCLNLEAQPNLVRLPGTAIRMVDEATGVPVLVRISALAVSPYEVTQREYHAIAGDNPSRFQGDHLPVQNVTWWEAIRYCNLRSIAENLKPCYDLSTGACDRSSNGYRLLTDAEWTYAAGKQSKDQDKSKFAHLGPADTKDTRELMLYARAQTPKSVGSLLPNQFGLHDMIGNVWEWVQNYNDPSNAIASAYNPAGPRWGTARMLRGGSFLTTTSNWAGNLTSSLEADRRSPYTGFRVCRSLDEDTPKISESEWVKPYQQAPEAFTSATGDLTSLGGSASNTHAWSSRKNSLHTKWSNLLGTMSCTKPAPEIKHIETHQEPTYTGELLYLQVEPDYWEKIYVMIPRAADRSKPLRVVVVPYYDVDTPAGKVMGGRRSTPLGTRAYGHLAVQQGMAAIAIRWFGQSYGENPAEVVANLKQRHPKVTGMGKWIWDSQRLLDYIATRPEFDSRRIGMIGHSLGGKMTLYAAAMDDRIRVAVSSEPGIGLTYSNYDDFWYLGETIREMEKGTDHHELLALIAPRPFLLIGGDSADNDTSWHYINSARQVYSLFNVPLHIGYVNHRQGHSPTPESIYLTMEWLTHFLKP